jgi:hypothetical protein
MNYQYTYVKIEPKHLFMQVKYSSEGKQDVLKNFDLTGSDFSQGSLDAIVERYAPVVVARWKTLDSAPDALQVDVTPKAAEHKEPIVKQSTVEDFPAYDAFTQKVIPKIEETETTIREYYVLESLSQQEKDDHLAMWRSAAQVTPRQARLELAKRGQLSSIDTIIASLPADQQEVVQIEWEYAVSVERASPWVIQLGSALGLDEEGLDELFKAAAEL